MRMALCARLLLLLLLYVTEGSMTLHDHVIEYTGDDHEMLAHSATTFCILANCMTACASDCSHMAEY